MNSWIPDIGAWVSFTARTTGEVRLGMVDQRFKQPTTDKITLLVEGQRVPLEDCSPPSFDLAFVEYQRLLERCAQLGELPIVSPLTTLIRYRIQSMVIIESPRCLVQS